MKKPRITFLGSKEAGLYMCKALIKQIPKGTLQAIICPDDTKDQRSITHRFIELAKSNSIPFYITKNSTETKELLKLLSPTTALVHGWYQIIPVEQFKGTRFFGFHYSALPKYRGNAPLVWQIINGENKLGVTFFQLSAGTDEGDIISQKFFSLRREESIADAIKKANKLARIMLKDFLINWPDKPIELSSQFSGLPSYCGLRLPEDGRINWHTSSDKIHDFIRAQSKPYPGAFTYLPDHRKITIWKSAEEKRNFYGVPGSVVEISQSSIVIACGEGALKIEKIEVEGQSDLTTKNIFKSLKIRLK